MTSSSEELPVGVQSGRRARGCRGRTGGASPFARVRMAAPIAVVAAFALVVLQQPGAADSARAKPATAGKPAAAETADQSKLKLTGHGGPVRAVLISKDGRRGLSAGSLDYTMIYWDFSGEAPRIVHKFTDHDGPVSAVAFVPDGKRAISASDDGAITVWDLKTGKQLARLKKHTGKIAQIAVSRDGGLVATASWDRAIRLWDLKTYQPVRTLKGHKGPVNAVVFAEGDSALFSASYDGTIRKWQTSSGAARGIIYSHGLGINVLGLAPGGKQLVFGSLDGRAGVIDAETGEQAKVLRPHDGPVLGLAISARHGRLALSSGKRRNGYIHVYKLKGWEPTEIHHNPFTPVWAVAFAGDGDHVYYGGLDDFINIWQVSPRKPFEVVASKFPRRFEQTSTSDPGELQFARKCSICHTLTPQSGNRGGPTLYKLFGRRAGSVPGYPYSAALTNSEIIWNSDTISKLFSLGPEHYTPGTKMPLQRIKDDKQRAALVAYLKRATEPKPAAEK